MVPLRGRACDLYRRVRYYQRSVLADYALEQETRLLNFCDVAGIAGRALGFRNSSAASPRWPPRLVAGRQAPTLATNRREHRRVLLLRGDSSTHV
jgi:hypothetical protein